MRARSLGVIALAAWIVGCTVVRRGGGTLDRLPIDRAELARCAHAGTHGPFAATAVVALAGRYELHMLDPSGEEAAAARLELWVPAEPPPEIDALSGPPPMLVGATDLEAERFGLVIPGDPSSREAEAPGVGVYWFEDDATRIRLGAEANRLDRTRFDGAHATLTLISSSEDRFGGTWSSGDGVRASSGEFCARRLEG